MSRIALLTAANLVRGAPDRRSDSHLFDLELSVLQAAFAQAGMELVDVRWNDPAADWRSYDAALALAAWDYQDNAPAFLFLLDRIAADGVRVFNPPDLVRWNIRKTYLRDLMEKGVPGVPTLWPDAPAAADIRAAFDAFGADEVVLKRQVGAGAHGQMRIARGDAIADGPLLGRPGMIQPFLPMIAEEGEFSFIFIDGDLSHAILKTPAKGDYRIQPRYGGASLAIDPAPADLAAARNALAALDEAPLYARVDMVRGDDGALLLMELELIEPFLYPADGPRVGAMLAAALHRRLG